MIEAEWRALLEAFLEDRISAEAFARRFLEAFNAARRDGRPVPVAIAELQTLVEQFDAEAQGRDEGDVDPRQLRAAAARVRSALEDGPSIAPGARTYDRARVREDMRRFQIQMTGCAGIGCALALLWVVLCLVQITFVSDLVQRALGFSAWPSAFIGFFLAFVPVVGGILAFIDATQYRGWHPLLAAIIFFAAPAATLISGWSRWRRYGR